MKAATQKGLQLTAQMCDKRGQITLKDADSK